MKENLYSVIIGATSGIGKAIAYKLAKEGYHLILVGRSEKRLKELESKLEKYPVEILTYKMDLTDKKEIDDFDTWLRMRQIKIEIFVNNAGVGSFGAFEKISLEENMNIIETNIGGFTYLLKVMMKYILRGGTILQVASTAAFAPGPYMSVYYASKSYVLSLSMAIREELKKEGIQVSILCPGPTQTAFQKIAKMQKTALANQFKMSPLEVAECAYRGMLKRKVVIVPGKMNKLAVLGMSAMPLGVSAKVVGLTQKQ